MLPLGNRLKHRSDFKEVLASGVYIKGKLVSVKFIKRLDPDTKFTIGFLVSKKFSKRATDRNRLKRQLRAIIREFLGQLVGGFRLIIIASQLQTDAGFNDLRDDLRDLLTRAKLYGD